LKCEKYKRGEELLNKRWQMMMEGMAFRKLVTCYKTVEFRNLGNLS
jgi:hypothetical protein